MKLLWMAVLSVVTLCSWTVAEYDTIRVPAPFAMPEIYQYNFPHRDFSIANYGALRKGVAEERACIDANTKAMKAAIEACAQAGGGRVVVPKGEWEIGPVQLKSNVDLHLEKGSKLVFSDDPQDYLPAVQTSWEGSECMNYSPLVYAFRCDNVAITGEGTLAPKMGTWKTWFGRPEGHLNATKRLYNWMSFGEPVENRDMTKIGDEHMRPHLIHFNQCRYVTLDGFNIYQSPFWTIHMYRCESGVARHLNVYAHGHNNDGIDLEMTQNFLVENCTFDQGDDAVVIKSGRNHDAWRINRPTQNIVVRNCKINQGHVLLGIGSEMAGGVRNVYVSDCSAPGRVLDLFYMKTNRRRGAFIDHIYMERVKAYEMNRAMAIDTDVLYQWKDLVPTYKDTVTKISNIFMKDVTCVKSKGIVELNGDKDQPIRNVHIEDLHVDSVANFLVRTMNVVGYDEKNVTYDWYGKQRMEGNLSDRVAPTE